MKSLAKLRDAVKERLTREHAATSRQKVKRALLDALDRLHKFEPPPTLVEEEFDRVWKSVLQELENDRKTFADEDTTEDKAKAEYRAIAERRVRLGLVLAEIGEKNNLTVSEEELNRAVMEHVRQFPGQEQRVWDYYRQNPQAIASLRAPIFEEKVVDFLLELATVTDKKVTREELYKEDEAAPVSRRPLRPAGRRELDRRDAGGPAGLAFPAIRVREPTCATPSNITCRTSSPWWSSRPTAASGPMTSSRGC